MPHSLQTFTAIHVFVRPFFPGMFVLSIYRECINQCSGLKAVPDFEHSASWKSDFRTWVPFLSTVGGDGFSTLARILDLDVKNELKFQVGLTVPYRIFF